MKGTMSELELSMFRQRSHEALKQKARRGELFLRVVSGYVKAGKDRIEKDPDQRVQEVLAGVWQVLASGRALLRGSRATVRARWSHRSPDKPLFPVLQRR
jgi:DNA invertase Pin-like site-specific DNA recombinase